jgi:two-component system sensor histidine kinase CreC
MSISRQVFLGIVLVAVLAAALLFNNFREQLKPLVQQATEDMLVETANVLAPVAEADLAAGHIADGRLAGAVRTLHERKSSAHIWKFEKTGTDLEVYVTDASGRVLYDSEGRAVGQDYSRWNDVYLTLQGRYGSRSTKADPADKTSSVMYVAAPLRQDDRLIGVISVSKPTDSLTPFLQAAEAALSREVLLVAAAAMALALALAWWIARGIHQLVAYADAVSAGRRASRPALLSGELNSLGHAMEKMREELEGKAYIERYVQALTHEIKSPLAAIRAAAELLEDDLRPEDRARFLTSIQSENARAQRIIERLLELAQLEQRHALNPADISTLSVTTLWQGVVAAAASRLQQQRLTVSSTIAADSSIEGDAFLLQQALRNLLDNAIDFSSPGSTLHFSAGAAGEGVLLTLRDEGAGIPDYALPRLFERFYSLPRPDGSPKSTGLGLPFVREIATLHGGRIDIANCADGGVEARLWLPLHQQ